MPDTTKNVKSVTYYQVPQHYQNSVAIPVLK